MHYEGVSDPLFLACVGFRLLTLNFKPLYTDQPCSHINNKRTFSSKAIKKEKIGNIKHSLSAQHRPLQSQRAFYVNFLKVVCHKRNIRKGDKREQTEALIQWILFLSAGALRVSSRWARRVNESAAVKISLSHCWRRGMEEATKKGR